MDDSRLVAEVARELLKKRRDALECAKNFEQTLREISKNFHFKIDLNHDTVTEEVVGHE